MKLIFSNFYQVLSLCILVRQVAHWMLSQLEIAGALTDTHAGNNWGFAKFWCTPSLTVKDVHSSMVSTN